MNRRDSSTKNFKTPSRSSYILRMKKRKLRKTILLCLLSVLILILLIAVVFVIRDMVRYSKNEKDDPSKTSGDITTAAPTTTQRADLPEDHLTGYAVDGDPYTYMLSSENQKTGAWLMLDLGSATDIGSVSVISNHKTSYIRWAYVQLSENGTDWTTIGEFTGTPSNDAATTFDVSPAKSAKYARIILVTSAQDLWAVNEFSVVSNNGARISPVSTSVGMIVAPTETTTEENDNGFENKTVKYDEIYTGNLILVNNSHLYVYPKSDINISLMSDSRTNFATDGGAKYSYQIGEIGLCSLDYIALKAMNDMCDAFYKESGINSLHVGTNSGYRSKATQDDLYAKYPSSAAKPGTSDHLTGLGVNFDIYENKKTYTLGAEASKSAVSAAAWLDANAYKYGFVQRYPAGKDTITGSSDIDRYHYRYVGYAHAYYMTSNNLCLEEYLTILEGYTYSGKHLTFTAPDNTSYEIYFIRADGSSMNVQIPVPKNLPYTISGNNYSGFVVTIQK